MGRDLPQSRECRSQGRGAKIVQDATRIASRSVAEAQGRHALSTQVLEEYKRAPDVTRQRLYLKRWSGVYSHGRQDDHRQPHRQRCAALISRYRG